MTVLHLHTVIEPMGPAGALVLSDEQVAALGGGKRAAVVVRIGDHSARLRLAVMGGLNVIGISKANRAVLHVGIGETVDAEVSLDDAPRTVAVPDDLMAALVGEPELRTRFESLPYTQRRELVEWVEQAKRPETRQRRIVGTLDRLRSFETAARPADGVWGTIGGIPVTDDVIDEVVRDAEEGFPGATFRPVGRPRTVQQAGQDTTW